MVEKYVIVVDDMTHALDMTMDTLRKAGIPAKGVFFSSEVPMHEYDPAFLEPLKAKGYVVADRSINDLKHKIDDLLSNAVGIVSDFHFANIHPTGHDVMREIAEEEGQPFRVPYLLCSGHGGKISRGVDGRLRVGPVEVPSYDHTTFPEGVMIARKRDPLLADLVKQEFGLEQNKGKGL